MKNVSVSLKDESDEEEEEESDKESAATREQIMGRGKRTAVLDSKLRVRLQFCSVLSTNSIFSLPESNLVHFKLDLKAL